MPAPPFPTNLLLRKIFAGTLSHSKNSKPLVRGKLSVNKCFLAKSPVGSLGKLSVNKCFLAKSPVGSLPFVHREISHCGEISVRARALPRETQRRETLLAGFYFWKRRGMPTSLAPSLRELSSAARLRESPYYKKCVMQKRRFFLPCEKLSSAARLRESPHFNSCLFCAKSVLTIETGGFIRLICVFLGRRKLHA